MQEQDLKNKDALIAHNRQTGETGVVTGLAPDGTPQMESPGKASQFLTFDRHADMLDNFLRNFMAQCKNPSTFGFFKIPADQTSTMGVALTDIVKSESADSEMLKGYEVKPPVHDTVTKGQATDENKIDWEGLKAWGITKESIGEQNLKDLLNNRMTDLVKITPALGGEKFDIEARLSLRRSPDGNVKVVPHFIRKEPNLNQKFHGVKFTNDDKTMLKLTGNLGRVIDLKDNAGNSIPSFVSIDRKTNELIALPVSSLYIRNKIGQTELPPKEIALLKSGKQLEKEVTLNGGKTFKTVLQVSAAEQKAEFVPVNCRLNRIQEKQQGVADQKESLSNNWTMKDGSIKPIARWKGVDFTLQQQRDYTEGKVLKLDNVPDKTGKPSTVYIRFNRDKQRPYTYSSDPTNAKVVTPAEESKVQVAVNSQGKTNEATKSVKGPLDKGQTQPKPEQKKKGQKI